MEKPEQFRISWHLIGGPGINISLKKRFEEESLLGKFCPVLSRKNQSASHRESRDLALSKEVNQPLIFKFKNIFKLLFILVDRIFGFFINNLGH